MATDKNLPTNALLTVEQSAFAFGTLNAHSNALPMAAQAASAFGAGDNQRVAGLPEKSELIIRSAFDLGQKISNTRKQMNMTQQAFADLAGVGRRFLSELESGKPTLEFERVLKVCHAAGIDLIAVKR